MSHVEAGTDRRIGLDVAARRRGAPLDLSRASAICARSRSSSPAPPSPTTCTICVSASRRLRAGARLFDQKRPAAPRPTTPCERSATRSATCASCTSSSRWLRERAGRRQPSATRSACRRCSSEREAKLPKRRRPAAARRSAPGRETACRTVEAALAVLELRGRLGGHRVRQRLAAPPEGDQAARRRAAA